MFLKKLSLRDIRCFREADLSFDEPQAGNRKWTVLLGENGSGKSTVLKATALALAGSDALAELTVDPDFWIRSGADSGSIKLAIETAEGEERVIALEFRRNEGISSFIARSRETLEPLERALAHSQRSYPVFGYGASRRLAPDASVGSSARPSRSVRAQSVASLFHRYADLNSLESWAMNLDYRSDGAHLDVVRQVLSDFLPEISFSHIDKRREQLIFDTPDGEVPLSQLSEGYQNVAAWVGDLLYQVTSTFEDYNSPLDARGLLIIDEVDLHLHPIWQKRLLDFLDKRLPRMQLLVTTHALVTAQQSPLGALHYCVRRETGPMIERFTPDPGKLLLHQLLATEAFGQMSDESLEVERLKLEYREIRAGEAIDEVEVARMQFIESELNHMPADVHSALVLTEKQQDLLKKILNEGQVGR